MKSIILIFLLLFIADSYSQNRNLIIQKAKPNIVTIISYDQNKEVLGRATGFFIEKNGKNYIATNRHVTDNASSVKIKL